MACPSKRVFFSQLALLFIIFNLSSLNLPADKSRYTKAKAYFSETARLFRLAAYQQNDIGMGMTSNHNNMVLLNNVQPAYELLYSEIEKAEENINIEMFTIRDDQSGNEFKALLIKKAKQGIEVRLLYDAWGSAFTSKTYFDDLRENGVKAAAFNPLLPSFLQGRLDNRLHRKMIIIDGKIAFIGSENIGDEYLGKDKRIGFWKDTGLLLQGDSALSVQQIFLADWLQSTSEKVLDKNYYQRLAAPENPVKIILGGPDSKQTDICMSYVRLITKAERSIQIITPYFIPNKALITSLYQAADRNVDVHLILPHKNDNKAMQFLQPLYVKRLKQHGIRVSTYNHGFIHSKVMIIDNKTAVIGTANLDRISFEKNYEVISVVSNKDIIQALQQDFAADLRSSGSLPAK